MNTILYLLEYFCVDASRRLVHKEHQQVVYPLTETITALHDFHRLPNIKLALDHEATSVCWSVEAVLCTKSSRSEQRLRSPI